MSLDCHDGQCCSSASGNIHAVSTSLALKDIFAACKIRLGIGRMNYAIPTGLYAVGKPGDKSPVLVSANYKLTFDELRKNLDGLNAWLLILDTNGVNVWCAAGKGTFGTEELVKRIELAALHDVVSHRELILPQLGAAGIAAHEVKKRTGFSVIYGSVRASDIQAFISEGNKATKRMRLVEFSLRDRLVLIPVEFLSAAKKTISVFGLMFFLNIFAKKPFTKHDILALIGAVLSGTVVTPLLLPYIPAKAFSFKGWLIGLGWTVGCIGLNKGFAKGFAKANTMSSIGKLLLLPVLSAYHALNFTGSSTYVSPSGVKKELKIALPLMAVASAVGLILILTAHLFGGKLNEKT